MVLVLNVKIFVSLLIERILSDFVAKSWAHTSTHNNEVGHRKTGGEATSLSLWFQMA